MARPVIPMRPEPDYGGYQGSSIADLIMRGGAYQAEAARAQGSILGETFANLGQIGAQALEARNAARAAGARDAKWTAYLQGGAWLKDPAGAVKMAYATFDPKTAATIAEGLRGTAAMAMEGDKAQAKDAVAAARAALKQSDEVNATTWPGLAQIATPVLRSKFGLPEEQVAALQGPWDPKHRELLTAFVETYDPPKPKEDFTMSPGQVRFGPDGKPIASVPAAEKKGPEVGSFEDYVVRSFGPQATPQQVEQARQKWAQLGHVAAEPDAAPTLTSGALDQAAMLWLKTGQLPPMGMGKAGAVVRQAIMNRAAEMDRGADIATNRAGYRADTGSLAKLQQQTDAVTAFEETALKNGALLKEMAKKIPGGGATFLNRPIRALAGALGSEDMAAFNTLRQSVANEFGRIIANPNLAGMMSDSARHEADLLLSPNATPGQIIKALDTLAKEAKNRRESYQTQLSGIRSRINPGGDAGSKAPVRVSSPEEARKLPKGTPIILPDGSPGVVP